MDGRNGKSGGGRDWRHGRLSHVLGGEDISMAVRRMCPAATLDQVCLVSSHDLALSIKEAVTSPALELWAPVGRATATPAVPQILALDPACLWNLGLHFTPDQLARICVPSRCLLPPAFIVHTIPDALPPLVCNPLMLVSCFPPDPPSWHRCSMCCSVRAFMTEAALRVMVHAGLEELSVGGCTKLDAGAWARVLTAKCPLPALTRLDLSGSVGVSDAVLRQVAGHCPGLLDVDLRWCPQVTHQGISALVASCHGLTSLKLAQLPPGPFRSLVPSKCWGSQHYTSSGQSVRNQFSDGTVTVVTSGCRNLQSFVLTSCHQLSDTGIAALSSSSCCNRLMHLDLGGSGAQVTDHGVAALASSCAGLVYLDLSGFRHITDQAVAAIASCCYGLVTLILYACKQVTDQGVGVLVSSCPCLERLDLSWCACITDEGIVAIATRCTGLHRLDLGGSGLQVTDRGVAALASSCSGLLHLNVAGCKQVTAQALTALVASCPGLLHLYPNPSDLAQVGSSVAAVGPSPCPIS